jgi:hypothetical protein
MLVLILELGRPIQVFILMVSLNLMVQEMLDLLKAFNNQMENKDFDFYNRNKNFNNISILKQYLKN